MKNFRRACGRGHTVYNTSSKYFFPPPHPDPCLFSFSFSFFVLSFESLASCRVSLTITPTPRSVAPQNVTHTPLSSPIQQQSMPGVRRTHCRIVYISIYFFFLTDLLNPHNFLRTQFSIFMMALSMACARPWRGAMCACVWQISACSPGSVSVAGPSIAYVYAFHSITDCCCRLYPYSHPPPPPMSAPFQCLGTHCKIVRLDGVRAWQTRTTHSLSHAGAGTDTNAVPIRRMHSTHIGAPHHRVVDW